MAKQQNFIEIELQPLSEGEVSELIDGMSHSFSAGLSFNKRIFRQTLGNPLFVLSTLQNLFEEGILFVDDEGGWSTDLDAFTIEREEWGIARSIRELLEARLARLDSECRDILMQASILGQEFNIQLLLEVSCWSEERLLKALDDLCYRGFVREGWREKGYRFEHPMIREVIYVELDGAKRAALHSRVGEVLERRYRANPEKASDLLAYHFHRAKEATRTVRYAIMAGQQALRYSAHREANYFFQMALSAIEEANLSLTNQQQLAINQGLGDAYWMAGKNERAQDFYKRAVPYAEVAIEGDGLFFKCAYLDAFSGTSVDALIQRAEDFERKLVAAGDSMIEVHHFLYKGYGFLMQGEEANSRECYRRSREALSHLVTSSNEKRYAFDLAEAHRAQGEAYIWWGEYQKSAEVLLKALASYEAMGDLMGGLQTRMWLGELRARTGAWDQALLDLTQVVEETARIENLSVLPEALFRRGYVYCDRGEWELAEADAMESQKIAQEAGNSLCQAGSQFLFNRLMIRRGEPSQAIESCRAIEAFTRYLGVGLILCLALRYLGEAHLGLGAPDLARACCEEGLELARKSGFKREVGVIQRVMGEALSQQGEWDLAFESLRNSIKWLDRMNSPFELGESYRSLGKYQLERSLLPEAEKSLEAAEKIFERLGARHDADVTSLLRSELKI